MYGTIIKEIRKSKGMNLRKFGDYVGISFSYIAMLEKEKSYRGKERLDPALGVLQQICDRTGYSFRQFLEEAGYIEPVPVPVLTRLQELCGYLNEYEEVPVLELVNKIIEAKTGADIRNQA